jgi:hypothetical protein
MLSSRAVDVGVEYEQLMNTSMKWQANVRVETGSSQMA